MYGARAARDPSDDVSRQDLVSGPHEKTHGHLWRELRETARRLSLAVLGAPSGAHLAPSLAPVAASRRGRWDRTMAWRVYGLLPP